MTINHLTLDLFDEYYWGWRKFLAQFNCYDEPKQDIEVEKNLHTLKWGKNTYPIDTVYRMLRSMNRNTELFPSWVVLEDNLQIKEEDVPQLNEQFRQLIGKYLDKAEELRQQLVVTPLPPEQPTEFQILFYKLDPYCKKLKEKFAQLYQIIDEEELKESTISYEEEQAELKKYGAPARFRSDIFKGLIAVRSLTPRMEKQQDTRKLKKQLDIFIQSTKKWDLESLLELDRINEQEYKENPYHSKSYRQPYKEPIGSALSRLLKDKYHFFAADYESALNYFVDLLNNEVDCVSSIFSNVRFGMNLQILADEIDLPKDVRKGIWEDGYALENNLDIRGAYRFFLRWHPSIYYRKNSPDFQLLYSIQNEEHKNKITQYVDYADKAISAEDTFQGIGIEKYNKNLTNLKKIIEEQ